MIIERIDEKRLMIMLEEQDMNSLELTYEGVSWKNHKFKLLIAKLLALAKFKTGFSVDDNKLSIETIPQGLGCVIIFTLFPKLKIKTGEPDNLIACPTETDNPYIYKFDNAGNLLEVCERLGKINNSKIKSSSIYKVGKKYFMLIQPREDVLPGSVSVILSEYGKKVSSNRTSEAYLYESGKVIHKKNAISYIEKCLK